MLRRLTESGRAVRVIPTASALKFVGKPTWEALSGRSVSTDVFFDVALVPHVRIGQGADLVIVAPATADLLARAAAGRADDLLTAALLTTRAPVVFAPAMHTEMWEHPATVANVAILRSRGVVVIEPATGRLTGQDSGPGRLPEAESLMLICAAALDRGDQAPDLVGMRVLVTAGGTREPLDPVRYLGNRSSGRQAWALASAAVARGAQVQVIAANVAAPDPAGASVHRVGTAAELLDAVSAAAKDADVVVMAAAVADFRPKHRMDKKIKKDDAGGVPGPIELERTTDILAQLGSTANRPFLVGFAAETISSGSELTAVATQKLNAKGADLIVANEVGGGKGFETDSNAAIIVDHDGIARTVDFTTKEGVANAVWDLVAARLRKV